MSMMAFFVMDGYGLYVWSAIGLVMIMVIIEIVSVRKKYKKIVQRIKRIQQLRAAESDGGLA